MKKIRKRASAPRTLRPRTKGVVHDVVTDRHGIIIKTPAQIDGIRAASQLTRAILDMVAERIGEGVSTAEVDEWVRQAMADAGATPATLGYGAAPGRPGFPACSCTSVNDVVCHGIPSARVTLAAGDIVNVDVTSILGGYFGDASRMFCIGEVSEQAQKIVDVAYACMELGIETVKPGADFGGIGFAIQSHARRNGFSVVTDYGGHGVGLRFHEPPHVTHASPPHTGILMQPGMIFTIEPMLNVGKPATRSLADGWTAVTSDGSLSAQWEHTVLVTDDGVERLTA